MARALRFGWSRLLAVIWVSALTYLAILLGALAIVALIAVTVAVHIAVLTVLFAVVFGIAGFVAMVWFLVATRLAVPVLMLEDIRGIKAIRRALSLCRGYWWSVFGTQFLAGLLVSIASAVVAVVLDAVFSAFHGGTTMSVVSGFFAQTIDYLVFAPFSAAILVVLTIDLAYEKKASTSSSSRRRWACRRRRRLCFSPSPSPQDPTAPVIRPRATRLRDTHRNPFTRPRPTRNNRATRRKQTRRTRPDPVATRRQPVTRLQRLRPPATHLRRHPRLAGHQQHLRRAGPNPPAHRLRILPITPRLPPAGPVPPLPSPRHHHHRFPAGPVPPTRRRRAGRARSPLRRPSSRLTLNSQTWTRLVPAAGCAGVRVGASWGRGVELCRSRAR